MAIVPVRRIALEIAFLYHDDNEPVRGASVGVAPKVGRGWGRTMWSRTDDRGMVTFSVSGGGTFRFQSNVRGRMRETTHLVHAYNPRVTLWVLRDGALAATTPGG